MVKENAFIWTKGMGASMLASAILIGLSLTSIVHAVPTDPGRAVASGRNDVVYLAPATEYYEALALGNGNLGVMAANRGGLNYVFNPGSFFASKDQNQLLMSSGELTIRLPAEWLITGFIEQRLALYDGMVITQFKIGDNAVTVRSWLAEGRDLLVVEVEGTKPLPDLPLELTVWERLPYGLGSTDAPKTQALTGPSDIALVTAGTSGRRATALVAAPLAGDARDIRTQGQRLTLRISGGSKNLTILAASPVVRGTAVTAEQALAAARRIIAEARTTGLARLRQQHDQYWHGFWGKTGILMHSPDGLADYAENLYHLFLYWMAGMARGPDAPKFNGGNYLFCNDWRSWGGQYWYQNTREMYWALPAADHAELWGSFIDLYWRHLPAAKKLAREMYSVDGACYEETLNGADGGGDKRGNPYTTLYLTTGTEMALQMYRYYLYTRDERFLRDKVYPLLKETVTFHLNFVAKEADGRYHVYPSNTRETYWWVKDSATDLTALRATLPILISVSEKLGVDSEPRAHWREVLDHLTPFVTDMAQNVLLPGTLLDEYPRTRFAKVEAVYGPELRTKKSKQNTFNVENPACEPIYPWGLVGLNSPADELTRIQRTFLRRPNNAWTFGNAWDPALIWAARLGLTDEAVKALYQYVENVQMFPSGMAGTPGARPEIWGKVVGDSPGFDSAGVLAAGVQEMQLQGYGGRIRVFPAWPKGWQSEFTLVAKGDFLVSSAICADGGIPFIRIVSRQGGLVRIVNPWRGRVTLSTRGVTRVVDPIAEIYLDTTAGQTYDLRPKQVVKIPQLSVERNAGPKWAPHAGPADTAEAYLNRITHALGFLGIDHGGRNPARDRVKKTMGVDTYPVPPKVLFLAHYNRGLDADYGSQGRVKAEAQGARVTKNGQGYHFSESMPSPEAADVGHTGQRARLRYNAIGNVEVKQGTIEFYVKTAWDWDARHVKPHPQLVSIPFADKPGCGISIYAYMLNSKTGECFVGFVILDGKQTAGVYYLVGPNSPQPWKKDQWHHIAATWNAWRLQLFIDGKLVERRFLSDPLQVSHSADKILVGCAPSAGISPNPGEAAGVLIDELCILDQPINQVPSTHKEFSHDHVAQ